MVSQNSLHTPVRAPALVPLLYNMLSYKQFTQMDQQTAQYCGVRRHYCATSRGGAQGAILRVGWCAGATTQPWQRGLEQETVRMLRDTSRAAGMCPMRQLRMCCLASGCVCHCSCVCHCISCCMYWHQLHLRTGISCRCV